jgi:hypothetical protein
MILDAQQILGSPIILRGALAIDKRKSGIGIRRLPDWTRPQVPQNLDVMARMPSGVRLIFSTDSKSIAIKTQLTRLIRIDAEPEPLCFNLELADGYLAHAFTEHGNIIRFDPTDEANFELVRGEPGIVKFDNLPGQNKTVSIWLPHNAYVEIQELKLDDGASLAEPGEQGRKWLHHGSSISHCMEAIQPALTWPAVAGRRSGVNLQSLGFGGQCHLDQFVARTIRDSDADLISLKVGINIINGDTMRERVFVPALHGFLDTIREGKPKTPILLVSPIYCPSAEETPGPTIPDSDGKFITQPGHESIREGCLTLQRVRKLIARVVSDRKDARLGYLDGLSLFSAEDAHDLPDDLHPNPAGYIRMGERFAESAFGANGFFSR